MAKPKVLRECVLLRCNFCGKLFKRVIFPNTFGVSCSKCKEIDVEVVGVERR